MSIGILFNTAMTEALKADRKTQTRRVIKLPSPAHEFCALNGRCRAVFTADQKTYYEAPNRYGPPGSFIWAKETCIPASRAPQGVPLYRADFDEPEATWLGKKWGGWKPSILMSRLESRFVLRITDVRVQRLDEIDDRDVLAEGILQSYIDALPAVDVERWELFVRLRQRTNPQFTAAALRYFELWDSINAELAPVLVKKRPVAYQAFPSVIGPDYPETKDRLPVTVFPNPWLYALTFEKVKVTDGL